MSVVFFHPLVTPKLKTLWFRVSTYSNQSGMEGWESQVHTIAHFPSFTGTGFLLFLIMVLETATYECEGNHEEHSKRSPK